MALAYLLQTGSSSPPGPAPAAPSAPDAPAAPAASHTPGEGRAASTENAGVRMCAILWAVEVGAHVCNIVGGWSGSACVAFSSFHLFTHRCLFIDYELKGAARLLL